MTDAKHTDGPWVAIRDTDGSWMICGPGRATENPDSFRRAQTMGCATDEEEEANAHLLAAAPEMYALLEQIHINVKDHKDGGRTQADFQLRVIRDTVAAQLSKLRGGGS